MVRAWPLIPVKGNLKMTEYNDILDMHKARSIQKCRGATLVLEVGGI
jgi:hypothetical protein